MQIHTKDLDPILFERLVAGQPSFRQMTDPGNGQVYVVVCRDRYLWPGDIIGFNENKRECKPDCKSRSMVDTRTGRVAMVRLIDIPLAEEWHVMNMDCLLVEPIDLKKP